MEKRKKDNKGFSLVELIVVVLIIAIISVSLAPQVMKWVGTSKTNVDDNNAATIKSAVSIAVAEFMSTSTENPKATFIVNGTTLSGESNLGKAHEQIVTVMNGEWPKTKNDDKGFTVTITDKGQVIVSHGVAETEDRNPNIK